VQSKITEFDHTGPEPIEISNPATLQDRAEIFSSIDDSDLTRVPQNLKFEITDTNQSLKNFDTQSASTYIDNHRPVDLHLKPAGDFLTEVQDYLDKLDMTNENNYTEDALAQKQPRPGQTQNISVFPKQEKYFAGMNSTVIHLETQQNSQADSDD
jgi:hypothetical protein